jgi:hypothetical protein
LTGPRWTAITTQEVDVTAKPKAPDGLLAAGKALWEDVTGNYALRADELVVLTDACRTTDMIATLEAGFAADPDLMVRGSQGQRVINPLISELRQYRAARAALVKQLRLPDESSTPEARSTQARAAANARWSRRGA